MITQHFRFQMPGKSKSKQRFPPGQVKEFLKARFCNEFTKKNTKECLTEIFPPLGEADYSTG